MPIIAGKVKGRRRNDPRTYYIYWGMATFKSFISEKEVEEAKKKRQEEWEKVRRPDQPLGKVARLPVMCMRLN